MIEVIGHSGSPEYEAALKIRSALASYWPGIEDSPAEQDHVKIAANTKLAGYKVSDIDVVIAAKFARGRYLVPKSALKDKDGRRVVGAKIRVLSLVAAIEVKGHDARARGKSAACGVDLVSHGHDAAHRHVGHHSQRSR